MRNKSERETDKCFTSWRSQSDRLESVQVAMSESEANQPWLITTRAERSIKIFLANGSMAIVSCLQKLAD